MKQKRIIYIITSLRKSNSEDICHDKRETEKNCAGVLLGIADGGGYFKLHNVFRNSPVHLRDETPFHPAGGGSDDSILPHWIVVYFLAFPFWVYGFILIARESREMCRIYLIGEMIAKTICLICFVVFPTTLVRPVIDADGSF